ncbi:RNA-binding protein 33-like isoform X2 [Penaeus japonicus]|uniref:RNA-binding protein 33-like isoform X2 n=1 Tax=Penaeus japonicus TaxID=27405 RepID=UPI001C711F7D|nr:RNA-binding protein 33-like isoform X2 [Penaeus japonicus]
MGYKFLALMCVMACAWAQVPETTEASTTTTTTQVPILRQVNQVNDDGTYTYGFEAADGTFKLETRDENGNVNGKYGYLNEFGELKTVEYSAGNETGFLPMSDLLPKSVPVPAVNAVPQQQPALPAVPQFTSVPQLQPHSQFLPRPQTQFVSNPQQINFVPQPHFATQQLTNQPLQPQRPINIELDGFSEDRNEDGFVDGSPAEAAKGNPIIPLLLTGIPQPQAPQRPINIELDGFSEDRNEDGFVDGSPEEAAKGNPVVPFLPAGTASLPALPPVQTLPQPQLVPQQNPQGFNTFVPNQQFLAGQQRLVPQQFIVPQSVPQQFVAQQVAGQNFLPQQFVGQPVVPQQPVVQRAFPHQFIPQHFAQFQQLRPVVPPQPVITKA